MSDLRLNEARQMIRTFYARILSLQAQLDFTRWETKQYLDSIAEQPPQSSQPSETSPGQASTPPEHTEAPYPGLEGE